MSTEKRPRNKRVYNAWLRGDSYRTIARRFKLDVKTIFVIVQRYRDKLIK